MVMILRNAILKITTNPYMLPERELASPKAMTEGWRKKH